MKTVKIINILVILFVSLPGSSGVEDNGTIQPGSGRLDPPPSWGAHTVYNHNGANLDMAWHHVIPWDTLRNFWNKILLLNHDPDAYFWKDKSQKKRSPNLNEVKIYGKILIEYLKYLKFANPQSIVDRMKSNNFKGEAKDEFLQKIIWQKWNIVEGPKGDLRSDDPGSSQIDKFKTGLDEKEQGCHTALQALYDKMKDFDTWDFQRFNYETQAGNLIAAFSITNKCDESILIKFKVAMWTFKQGKWKVLR